MERLLNALAGLIERFTARAFLLSSLVIYLVATRPDMSVEQIVGLLGALGFVTARAVAEDKVARPIEVVIDPLGDDETINNTK